MSEHGNIWSVPLKATPLVIRKVSEREIKIDQKAAWIVNCHWCYGSTCLGNCYTVMLLLLRGSLCSVAVADVRGSGSTSSGIDDDYDDDDDDAPDI